MDYIYNYYLGGPYVGALLIAMEGINFWLTALICVIVLMLPVLTTRFYAYDVNPSLVDKIRLKRKMQKKTKSSEDTTRTPSARRARRSLRSGYAFAHHVSSLYGFKLIIATFNEKLFFHSTGRIWPTNYLGKNYAKIATRFCISTGPGNKAVPTAKRWWPATK